MRHRPSAGRPCRLVVLVSGAGSNLAALLDACGDPDYGATIVAVGADRAGIRALEIAEQAGLHTFVVRPGDHAERAAWDRRLAEEIAAADPDLIVSAGFMRLLGPNVLARFPERIVNTHPALLPAFPGAHGVRDALAHGARLSGATMHVVDSGVDTGPIIAQTAVPVEDDDTEATLHERIKIAERAQLVDFVGRLARQGWTISGGRLTIP